MGEAVIGFKRYWVKKTVIPVNDKEVRDFFFKVGTRDYYVEDEEIIMMEKIL